MSPRQRTITLFSAVILSGAMHAAHGDDAAALSREILTLDAHATSKGSAVVTGKIATDFQDFAGSKENATALVTGLRSGSEITLTKNGYPSATFTPPTKPMGYGNVSTSLGLAQYQLAQQGIANPTPEQLKIALSGGTITFGGTSVEYAGVLQMRADGMGWGQIAQQLGTKLGPIVSGIKTQNAGVAALHNGKAPTSTGATTAKTSTSGATPSNAANRSAQGGGQGIVNAAGGPAKGVGSSKDERGLANAAAKSSAGRGIVSAGGHTGGSNIHSAGGGHGHGSASAAGAATGGSGHGKALGHNK